MIEKNKRELKNKFIKHLILVFINSMCLFLVTACEANRPPDTSHDQKETPMAQDLTTNNTTNNTEKYQDIETPDVNTTEMSAEALINADGLTIIERFEVPQGFARLEPEKKSFAYYLQNLPLKPDGTKVNYYDGREKQRNVYLAVVDFSLGERDLQQCADAVIRLKAEYLYSEGRFDEIQFNFVSGFNAQFSKWADGKGISVDGSKVSWIPNNNNNSSYKSFQKYLDMVYAYASTLSLEKELITKSFKDLAIGDVFIQGGSPGHCVIVVDMAVDESLGKKVFMLAQSYMPAQDIQILKGNEEGSPWYSADTNDILDTPEWTFNVSDLKTWE